MANFKIGSNTSTIYVGNQEVSKVYQGAIKVFDTDPSGSAYAQVVKEADKPKSIFNYENKD